MAEENVDGGGRRVGEMRPERREARARIDDEKPLAAANLDARRMAAERDELGTRSAGRTPDSPESDLEVTRG